MPGILILQSNLAIRNGSIGNKLVLRNHFLRSICHLLQKDKELLALGTILGRPKSSLLPSSTVPLKYGFHRKKCNSDQADLEKNEAKLFNYSELHLSDVTSYKIHAVNENYFLIPNSLQINIIHEIDIPLNYLKSLVFCKNIGSLIPNRKS